MLSIITNSTLVLATLCHLPNEDIAAEQVDLVEVNHYYNEQGVRIFDQLIFYDWSTTENRYQVRAWRLVKTPSQMPTRNWTSGGYDVLWVDADVTRHVHARAMRESWTQHDPELSERNYLPKDQRRELYTPRVVATVAP
jgi:hypothetical protein